MRDFCITTDSNSDLPQKYIDKFGTVIIPQYYSFGDTVYGDELHMPPTEFYEKMKSGELPQSQANNPAVIEEKFRAILDNDMDIIHIAFSSALSGSYNNVCMVARELAEEYTDAKITVIDSKIACFGEGLLAIKAAEMAEAGKESQEIVKEIKWMMKHQEFLGVDGKLDYLIYNGRLKGGKALMGKMLQICPVVHFTHEGELCALQSVRTPKKALMRTCEILKEMIGDRSPEDYILWHVYTGTSLLNELVEIEKRYDISTNHEPVIVSPVSGAHNGPWLAGYGLLFLRRDDEPLED